MVYDQVGTPTYALDLANAISVIVEDNKKETEDYNQWALYSKSGIYHFSNEGVCSWFDFTKMIADYAGNRICDIQPCQSLEFPSPVRRPSHSVLDKSKVKTAFGTEDPYWAESLKKCIININMI